MPTTAAANTPTQRDPETKVMRKPVMAPISMTPSMPRFKTPDRSARISPKVANMMGVAILIMAPMSPAMKAPSSIPLMTFSPP